jgi:hypothetical protein|tara:strand:+ start:1291 stop:1776 length:486 start_codon:yes stop_codon:yes gene_type:complete
MMTSTKRGPYPAISTRVREFFRNNPEAKPKDAMEACGCSYPTAWRLKKELAQTPPSADLPVVVRSKDHIPTSLRSDSGTLILRPHGEVESAVSDGSTASYYQLPGGATELQDLISFKNMNAQIGEIFRACYRNGQASHSDCLRDAKKMRFYINAEIKRLGG